MQLDYNEIKKIIPQRFPFIMIDRVSDIEPGKKAVAIKNITGNDIFFLGPCSETVSMPNSAIIEAMAQSAIVLFAAGRDKADENSLPLYYFGAVKAQFYHSVAPGDQLKIVVVNVKSLPTGAYVSAEALVEDTKIAEADLVFSVKNE